MKLTYIGFELHLNAETIIVCNKVDTNKQYNIKTWSEYYLDIE